MTPDLATFRESWLGRFLAPAHPRCLAILRVGLAGVLLLQALALGGSLHELYGQQGIVPWSIAARLTPPAAPTVGGLAQLVAPLGLSEPLCLRAVFLLYVASLGALLVGWRTRCSAVLAWLLHLMLLATGFASSYGVDQLAHIALFYCIWFPVGHDWSLDCLAGRCRAEPSFAAGLGRRVLQAHLCIVYFASGVEKAMGEQWWNGEAIWRATLRSDLSTFDFTWLAGAPCLAALLCWATLLVEIGYGVFILLPRARALWVLSAIALHAGIALTLGLLSFSALMIVLNVAAFLIPTGVGRDQRDGIAPGTSISRASRHDFLSGLLVHEPIALLSDAALARSEEDFTGQGVNALSKARISAGTEDSKRVNL
jgi:hypothetical protein